LGTPPKGPTLLTFKSQTTSNLKLKGPHFSTYTKTSQMLSALKASTHCAIIPGPIWLGADCP